MDENNSKKSKDVSAIVICYFTGPVLARCISSLFAQDDVSEVILIDNGSFNDQIEKIIQQHAESSIAAELKIISGHGNIGFAAACNKGAQAAKGEILLFLNPDAVLPEKGIERFVKDADKFTSPWMAGPKLVSPDGTEQQGSRRDVLTPWRAFVEATKLYKIAPQHPHFRRFNLHDDQSPSEVIAVPTISGACFMLPRSDFFLIDGMDERYFLHVEDVDFCLRFSKAGGTIFFNPNVSVTHFKSSSRANPVKIEARKTRGIIRYFNTHFESAYPQFFLVLVAAALWTSFGFLAARRAGGKFLRLAGLRARSGRRGLEKARAMTRRWSDR